MHVQNAPPPSTLPDRSRGSCGSEGLKRVGAHVQGLKQMSVLDVPIYITETGIADAVGDRRPLWLETYIPEVERAVRDGIDVRGLMYWTLVDNFEVDPSLQLSLFPSISAGTGGGVCPEVEKCFIPALQGM